MGAGTATATFFRSLGGAVGVAALGAVLSNKLAALAIARRAAGTFDQRPGRHPRAAGRGAARVVETVFVNALHPIFLTAGLVAAIAVVLSPGAAGPGAAGRGAGDRRDPTELGRRGRSTTAATRWSRRPRR